MHAYKDIIIMLDVPPGAFSNEATESYHADSLALTFTKQKFKV